MGQLTEEQAKELGIDTEAAGSAQEALEVLSAPPPKPEAPSAQAKETEKPAEPASTAKGWAAITKAEQALRRQREAFAAERQAFIRDQQAAKGAAGDLPGLKAAILKDPRNIEKLGIPLKDFLDAVLSGEANPAKRTETVIGGEIEELRQKVATLEGSLEQQRTAANEARFRADLGSVLSKPEYTLLASMPGAVDEMLRYSAMYFGKYGPDAFRRLTPEAIAATLQDTYREHVVSLRSNPAARDILGIPSEEQQTTVATAKKPPSKPRTITPAMSAGAAKGAPETKNKLPPTSDELLREAVKLVPEDVWDNM